MGTTARPLQREQPQVAPVKSGLSHVESRTETHRSDNPEPFDTYDTMLPAPCGDLCVPRGVAPDCPMRRSDSDLLRVPESQFDSLTRDELLRIVVLCRENDDA